MTDRDSRIHQVEILRPRRAQEPEEHAGPAFPRVISAEVVGSGEASGSARADDVEKVEVERIDESRARFFQQNGSGPGPQDLRTAVGRLRTRMGLWALGLGAGSGLLIWAAVQTESVLGAALLLLCSGLLGLIGLVMAGFWWTLRNAGLRE